MTDNAKKRIYLGPLADELAAELSGAATWEGLEAGIRQLRRDKEQIREASSVIPHLKVVYEALATMQLMLLALTPKDEPRVADAVERMSIRCEQLLQRFTQLADISGPTLDLLAERVRTDQHLNERGIEPADRIPERDGREH